MRKIDGAATNISSKPAQQVIAKSMPIVGKRLSEKPQTNISKRVTKSTNLLYMEMLRSEPMIKQPQRLALHAKQGAAEAAAELEQFDPHDAELPSEESSADSPRTVMSGGEVHRQSSVPLPTTESSLKPPARVLSASPSHSSQRVSFTRVLSSKASSDRKVQPNDPALPRSKSPRTGDFPRADDTDVTTLRPADASSESDPAAQPPTMSEEEVEVARLSSSEHSKLHPKSVSRGRC